MTIEEMKANIQNGIIWLNENRPEWQDKVRQKIEAGNFNMIMPCNCIIGTVDGSYWNLYQIDIDYVPIEAIECGFALPDNIDKDEIIEEYDKLTQFWIEAINDL